MTKRAKIEIAVGLGPKGLSAKQVTAKVRKPAPKDAGAHDKVPVSGVVLTSQFKGYRTSPGRLVDEDGAELIDNSFNAKRRLYY